MRDEKPDAVLLTEILKKIANQNQADAELLKNNLLLLSDFFMLFQSSQCDIESRKAKNEGRKKALGADELTSALQPIIIDALAKLGTNSYNKMRSIAADFRENQGKIRATYDALDDHEKKYHVTTILGLIAIETEKKPELHHFKITLILIQIIKILSEFFNTLKKVVSEMHYCGFFKSFGTHPLDAGSKSPENPLSNK